MEVVLIVASFELGFRGWIAALLKVNDHLLELFSTFGLSELPTVTTSVCAGSQTTAAEVEIVKRHPFQNWTWEGSIGILR